jgi:hypothetical protein
MADCYAEDWGRYIEDGIKDETQPEKVLSVQHPVSKVTIVAKLITGLERSLFVLLGCHPSTPIIGY